MIDKPVQMLKSLALERGLDPKELEKEGLENGFLVNISGIDHIILEKYDSYVDDISVKKISGLNRENLVEISFYFL